MTLNPIGESHEVSITVVNGVDAAKFGSNRQIVLPPGHYALGLRCDFNLDFRAVATTGAVSIDVIAGHNYFVDGGLSAQDQKACIVRVVDTTGASQ